jgi:Fic family protein
MFAPRFTTSHRITAGLTLIERARGFLEAARLSDAWLQRMSHQALLAEAYATTHIEGTELTRIQAEQLWAGGTVAGAREDDVRELLNYRQAFNLVAEHVVSGARISEELICAVHARLVSGVRGDTAEPGVYRTVQNYIARMATLEIVYMPPPPGDVPELMRELVAWLETGSDVHPVLAAGIAQFQLVHIHPFVDGNGRTSRLLATLCLYRAGYDFKRLFTLSEYYDRDRSRFYRALQQVRELDLDLTSWLEFFVEGLATQLAEVRSQGERVIRRDVIAQEHGLSQRQALAVEYLLSHPELRIEDFETLCPDVNRRTLQRDLEDLVSRRVLKVSGAARAVRYLLQIKGL